MGLICCAYGINAAPGNPLPIVQTLFYYGETDSAAPLSLAEILATPGHALPTGADLTALFTNAGNNPKFLWIAYAKTLPAITQFYINSLDFGPLGPNATFSNPVPVAYLNLIHSTISTSTEGQPVTFLP